MTCCPLSSGWGRRRFSALWRQLWRYGLVGIAQNGVAYGLYLLLTWAGADPKTVVAITYPIAMLVSFLGNKQFTFAFHGRISTPALRFLLAHAISYLFNLALLYIAVDMWHWPHALVQLAAIFICAVFLFLALKFFVFPQPAGS